MDSHQRRKLRRQMQGLHMGRIPHRTANQLGNRTGKKSIRHQILGWVVVGAIILLLLGTGFTFMTASVPFHVLIADGCFFGASALLIWKFLTWEDARQQEVGARRKFYRDVWILTAIGLLCLVGANHYLNRPSSAPPPPSTEQKELIKSLVQYAEMNRIEEIDDELALNLRVQMQRQKYLSTKPSLPFNYFQFGFEVTYRAREGNWGGGVITPGMPLSTLGVHEWANEVSFVVRPLKTSEDAAQLKAFSDNLLLPPPIKWDLDQYIHTWGQGEEAIADVLDDETKKGHIFSPLDQDLLQSELFRRLKPLSVPLRKLADDARQYM